jgi:hypothetical protein
MPATYEPIASVALASTSSYDFTSIPGTYTDLVLVFHGTCAGNDTIAVRFNSDTGSNYSNTFVYGTGSAAGSGRDSSITQVRIARPYTGSTNAQFSFVASVMSYANTNVFKTFLSASADPGAEVSRVVGLWRSTSAITSITVKSAGGSNNLSNGQITLYGVKAA